ncbi:hypothetical protein GCM10023094_42040 [Rhodococcus olei]|uniref:Mce-associated membrane protein n=1 Tax=Rhodococcus olei TaxID=2161675 RepID=A0ABP8PFZ3_9NOCA
MGDTAVVEGDRAPGAGAQGTRAGRVGARRLGRVVVVVLAVGCLVLAAVCGVLIWQQWRFDADQAAQQDALAAARTVAMNLATVDHEHAEQDVERVLAGSTGEFRDDYGSNAASFVRVVQEAQVKTVGQRADAGIESWDGDHGTVLVEVASTVTNRTAAQPQARVWRLRMTMEDVDGGYKAAALEYLA